MRYLLDANVFIQAKNLHYGFDFCPAFWEWLDEANERKIVFSVEKVGDELIAGNDELAEWAKARWDRFFLPPDEQVLPAFARLSSWATQQNYDPAAVNMFFQVADYYLVAHALAHGFVIVTHEVPRETKKKIKIPDACIGLGIRYLSPYDMLRREMARFVLERTRL